MWRVVLTYNGRTEGSGKTLSRDIETEDFDKAHEVVLELQLDAARINGAIFVCGYSVTYFDPAPAQETDDD